MEVKQTCDNNADWILLFKLFPCSIDLKYFTSTINENTISAYLQYLNTIEEHKLKHLATSAAMAFRIKKNKRKMLKAAVLNK